MVNTKLLQNLLSCTDSLYQYHLTCHRLLEQPSADWFGNEECRKNTGIRVGHGGRKRWRLEWSCAFHIRKVLEGGGLSCTFTFGTLGARSQNQDLCKSEGVSSTVKVREEGLHVGEHRTDADLVVPHTTNFPSNLNPGPQYVRNLE